MSSIQDLTDLLESSRNAAAFTGAGVSTLSGIRDFRGDSGIYQDVDPRRMFDLSAFISDPGYYYSRAKDFIYTLHEKQPSLVHRVLAQMEQRGLLPQGVITQNIDLLHAKAGSRRVVELHGTPSVHRCLDCDAEQSYESVLPEASQGEIPRCRACGGVMKPDIVFFGEMLPEDETAIAFRIAASADLLLVLGSSLVVQPASSIPITTLDNGGKIVIVNRTPTPLDDYAVLRFSDLQQVFEALAQYFG